MAQKNPKTDPPAFLGAGGGGRNPGSVCQADTSGDVPIRLDVKHQDLAQFLEPPSSVLFNLLTRFESTISL